MNRNHPVILRGLNQDLHQVHPHYRILQKPLQQDLLQQNLHWLPLRG